MTALPHVEAQGLIKRYREGGRDHDVLRGVDLDIAAGECVALTGRSGSGKSTLLHIVAGIDAPDAGRLAIRGADLCAMTERARTLFRRRHIGLVFQFFNLIATLTVAENLRLPLELCGVSKQAGKERVRAFLRQVGLEDRADSYPDRLSGGEQQRVAVVRALIHRPALLLADEPTGNLDNETGGSVLNLLARLARAEGLSVLIATHSGEVAACADRVLALHDGVLHPAQ
jgi:putative ABC transport system ATP-binding protein